MARKYREGDEPVPGSGYRLTEFLGRGGFGEVWKASAPGGAEAALKIIQLGGTEGRKEFRALQLVKKIRHTHLVPIFSFWLKNAEGQIIDDALVGAAETCAVETKPAELRATMAAPPALVRPLAVELIIAMGLGDKSLYDRLQECLAEGLAGVPQDELLHYLEDAAEAIDFLNRPLHNLGSGPAAIQHCDIKPHNLMIVGGGAQVCDFGLARMMGADRTTTAAATLAYAAPECLVEGKPSPSTDQYSLAVSYYELKTGTLPYRDETLAAVMDAKRQGKLDFSKLSPEEQAVLRRATSQNPSDRFPSSLDMVNALKRAAAALPATQLLPVSRKTAKRSKLPLTLLGLLLLVGGSAGGYLLVNRDRFFKGQDGDSGGKKVEIVDSGNSRSNASQKKSGDADRRAGGQSTAKTEQKPPDPALPLLESAKSLIALGQWRPAWEKCDAAIEKNPHLAEAYFLRGRCALNLEPIDYDKAIADLEKAKSLDGGARFQSPPDFAAAYLGRGTALLTEKRYDEAIADLEQAGNLDAQDYRIFSRLGAAWLAKNRWQEAVDALSAALRINPNDDTDFVNRGRAYRKLGQSDKAVEDFLRAATLDPANANVQLQLGSVYGDLKEPAKAVAAFGKAIDIFAKEPADKNRLAHAYLDRASAYFDLIDAETADPKETEANSRKALADLTNAADSLDPKNDLASLVSVLELRLSCYEKLKEMNKAANDMNNLAYYLATSADAKIRDNRQAIGFATRACEITEWKDCDFLDTLAVAHAEAGQFADAAKWESKALELVPQETEDGKKKADEYRERLERYQKGEK
ncbi:MAG: tetratricopeptide repeat protein [Pirellulales bacterium]|nr:tetratricopeptide repeat protein [Pirellulales bacterium]